MAGFAVINAAVVADGEVQRDYCVIVEGGCFAEIYSGNWLSMPVVDAEGCYLVPGFIDMHIHGTMGHLCDHSAESLAALSSALPRFGVTSFLAGITPCGDEIALLKELAGAQAPGAEMLGFFLEGHYLSLTGAIQNLQRDYTPGRVLALLDAAAPYKIVFAVSPEIDELEDLLPLMTADGFPAFITHTAASAEQTERAISLGARHATHFYDVFPYPAESEPGRRACGTVEAILARKEATVDFILDGVHVEPIAVKMALSCKGPGGVCLISDANVAAGLPPGVYKGLGDMDVEFSYEGAPARRVSDGLLAGSGLTLDIALRNAVGMLGLPLPDAVKLVTENPARVLGLDSRKGRIKAGFDADFSLLDEDLRVRKCFVKGSRVY